MSFVNILICFSIIFLKSIIFLGIFSIFLSKFSIFQKIITFKLFVRFSLNFGCSNNFLKINSQNIFSHNRQFLEIDLKSAFFGLYVEECKINKFQFYLVFCSTIKSYFLVVLINSTPLFLLYREKKPIRSKNFFGKYAYLHSWGALKLYALCAV
jgi:hypothetical protein